MPFHKLALATIVAGVGALSLSGEEVHCVGDRAHLLKYDVAGEPNDGSSLTGIENAVVSIEPSSKHASKCAALGSGNTPSGDKSFCYGANQDSTCANAKADIPLDNGELDCKDCFVGATADLFYKLNYSMKSLHSVEVGLQDMHLRGAVSVYKHLQGSKTLLKGTKVFATNASQLTVIDKLVGCPVCIKAKIVVAAPTSMDYEVDVNGQTDIQVGAEVDINLGERSVKWDRASGWTYPKTKPVVNVKPLLNIGNVQSEADVKLSVDTSLQVNIDDIIWYHVNVKPQFPLTCKASGSLRPVRKAQFCLKGDADMTVAHEADLHWKLFKFKEFHHWGPYVDYSWSKSGVMNECKAVGPSSVVV